MQDRHTKWRGRELAVTDFDPSSLTAPDELLAGSGSS
jgi:hypothetical protein